MVRLQGLERLDYLVERLVGVERAEALVDEQALQRLVPVRAGAEIGRALGERQGQGAARAASRCRSAVFT